MSSPNYFNKINSNIPKKQKFGQNVTLKYYEIKSKPYKPKIVNIYGNIKYNNYNESLTKGTEKKNENKTKKIKEERGKSLLTNYKVKMDKKEMDMNQMKEKLLKSQIGFYNAGGSCYMASIIQILIHLDKFLNEFLKNKLKKLGEENNGKIVNLFAGKKYIKFIGMPELDYKEDFIFYLISLDENTRYIMDAIYQEKEFEDDENMKLSEEIIIKPEILVINLEIKNIEYDIEQELIIDDIQYELKAINRYSNFHSTA